jgi:hypothetical protein
VIRFTIKTATMKSVILSAVMLFALSTSAQLKPRAAFDYFPRPYTVKVVTPLPATMGITEWESLVSYGSFRVRVGADYTYWRLSAYFDQHVYMNKARDITFQPLQAEWYAGIKFHITGNVLLKFEHLCIHPVVSDRSYHVQTRVYGGYNMFSISYGY